MKKFLSIPLLLILFVFLVKGLAFEKPLATAKESRLTVKIGSNPVIYNPSRIGINLGRWNVWGTEQYSNDLIMNPGFEGKVDRVIVLVSHSEDFSFSDEPGLGYPDNYWSEAEYAIQTGASQGKKGVIERSVNSGLHGLPQYFSKERLPPIQENDVIVLTKVIRSTPTDHWAVNDKNLVQFDPYENRTLSPGSQSIRLRPSRTTPAALYQYADTAAERTGRMRPVNGQWVLSFWAKGEKPGTELEVAFQREGNAPPFLKEIIYTTTEWQEFNLEFSPHEGKGEAQGQLKLSMIATLPNISIWIDDVSLHPKEKEAVFRKEVVVALKMLHPSFLREFAHLGDTWENRIASPFERKSFVSRQTGNEQEAIYSYSIVAFLDLCAEIQANPWLIIPSTFSDYECKKFGAFLSENAGKSKFSEVILEFGADNSNWLNRPVGIPYPKEHGEAADRCFKFIAEGAKNGSNIRFLINGQFSSPENALETMENVKAADGLAIAPYFYRTLDKGTPDDEALEKLFNQNLKLIETISDLLFSKGKSLAVSEINLHTTEGSARAYERNRVVAGAASGSALVKNILTAMYAKADPILINTLGQYDTPAWDTDDYVPLWGVVRDFGPPPLFRPTGLAMIMLNQVIDGTMYSIKELDGDPHRESLVMAAFKSSKGWTAAIVSREPTPLQVTVEFPDDGNNLPNTILSLESSNPFETNEEGEKVKITSQKAKNEGRVIKTILPPWGFIALTQTFSNN